MRASIFVIAFSALAAAQSSAPAASITSQPLIPTGIVPPGASSGVAGSSSPISSGVTTTTTKHSTTSDSEESSSTSDSDSSTPTTSTTSTPNAAVPIATGGPRGLSAVGLAGAALVAFL